MNDKYDETTWKNEGRTINSDLTNFHNTRKYIEEKIEEEKRIKGTDENLQMIEEYLESVNNEILPLANEIYQKTKYYTLPQEDSYNEDNNDNVPQGNLLVQDLANNQEVLQERKKQLEQIVETSAKIKDISDAMVKQLNDQGVILDDAENKVIESEENAKKAREEINKADQLSRSNKKKFYCFVAIIVLAILTITAILLALLLN
jgi:DNA repair exonuclease SbcCD ATPase subunit